MTVDPDEIRLRRDALACFMAGVDAVEPRRLVEESLGSRAEWAEGEGPVWVAGIGKAAAAMSGGATAVLGPRLAGGVLITPTPAEAPPGLRLYRGGHPVPDAEGAEGARAVLTMAEGLGEGDRLLCLISGGGSALMTLPPAGVPLDDVRATTDLLLRAGATIAELNCVRKHLDLLKGGRLARAAAPARLLALVLSDVVGDPLDVIASGPVSPDPSTYADAVGVLESHGLWQRVPETVRGYLGAGLEGEEPESPGPGDPCFAGVEAHVVGNNRMAAEAAVSQARELGYHARLLSTFITGEAREVGRILAALGREMQHSGEPVTAPGCLVASGETTVRVRGSGRGGRNQEVALGAALELEGESRILVLSAGTDGIDGPTDAAGAYGSGSTLERARGLGLDARAALADNDAYPFFEALGDLVITGPTGTNVMDLYLIVACEES